MQAKAAHAAADEARTTGRAACNAKAANLQRMAKEQAEKLKRAQQRMAEMVAEDLQRVERTVAKQQSELTAVRADEGIYMMGCLLSLLVSHL